ncbi:hypothetical protein [Streptomyces hainanensis]|uniref:Uncharacterized protein n=1 Tax=Streptomyces hainanensis TaxID=402648 RepID=A0A4R4TWT7_9ACTN|nr:hypothetical protein [Streptomyces hainanensis]TDC79713.1 hypothetical protein E1283_02195 [Streptomyces hainanensis]
MSDPMSVLAMAGATTIVAAMATSAWDTTRARAAALFRRRGEEEPAALGAQLDGDARLVADDPDPDAAREDLLRPWARRLAMLLNDHPEAGEDVRLLVERAAADLPPGAQHWAQHITAHAGGTAFGAQGPGSSVHVHLPEEPGAGSGPGPGEPAGGAGRPG